MRRINRKRRGAFTLLEILVVLSVMALLAGWLVSATMRTRERATRVVCTSNLRQLVQACKMYEADNEHLPVQYGNRPPHGPMGHWQNQVWPYIQDQRVYICPMDPHAGRTGGAVHTELGWPYSYPYFLSHFWLNPDGSYRPPAPLSPLFTDSSHIIKDSNNFAKAGSVFLDARYDGSVKVTPVEKSADVTGYEPADGKGMLR